MHLENLFCNAKQCFEWKNVISNKSNVKQYLPKMPSESTESNFRFFDVREAIHVEILSLPRLINL
jgi:hypothetical protein